MNCERCSKTAKIYVAIKLDKDRKAIICLPCMKTVVKTIEKPSKKKNDNYEYEIENRESNAIPVRNPNQ